MNARLVAMFLVAVVMAGAAAWLAKRYIAEQAVHTPAKLATTPVVVAAGDIRFASKIELKEIKLAEWPSSSVPAGALQDPKQVEGKIAQRSFSRDEPITRERLRDHLGGSTLSAMIKPGRRAMSVRVDDVAGVAGFILPGNKVDILGTRADKASYTVLSGVNVLAVGQEASPEKNQPALVRSLTVEVSPQQAELLDQAGHRSPLRFTLRNPYEEQPMPPAQAAVPASQPSRPVAPPPAPRRASVALPTPSVTIIEWTGKGQVAVDRCSQWPCAAGKQRASLGVSQSPSESAHQGLLDAFTSGHQVAE